MKLTNSIVVSASDLSGHASCKHLTYLDLSAALGLIEAPDYYDPALAILQERGREFEDSYLNHLKQLGLSISKPNASEGISIQEATIQSMKEGSDIIYQGAFESGNWHGRADFLVKTNVPSKLGSWSYEVSDSKLAKETRAGTILQLCLYSEMIAEIQGVNPEFMHVVTPEDGFKEHSFRLDDFWAYYRLMKRRVSEIVAENLETIPTYPEPCSHCEVCRWWKVCDEKRRSDDHLSIVAGLSNSNAKEITLWDVHTVNAFSKIDLPLKFKPSKGAKQTYEKLREQARVQVESRIVDIPKYELLSIIQDQGLSKLPQPSIGDIFFDFEGDPYIGTSGLEYLFGWTVNEQDNNYSFLWALNASEEKIAFERFVDLVMERLAQFPDMHIYHFTAYEQTALKRLMGKYGTRENEIDKMLRSNLFIDLYNIVKHSVRAGVEKYSLKELEVFHGFNRKLPLRHAAAHLRSIQGILERGKQTSIPQEITEGIQLYNQEDCLSTKSLRDWLEGLREEQISAGHSIERPQIIAGEASDQITEHQQRIAPLFDALVKGIPIEVLERNSEEQAKWILAHMLDWYRREKKALWWEYYRLKSLTDLEHLDEKSSIGLLTYTGHRVKESRSSVDTYTFPTQDYELREGDELKSENGDSIGSIFYIDKTKREIGIKKSTKSLDDHPTSVFKHNDVRDTEKEEAVIRLASWVISNGMDASGDFRAGRDLLMNNAPRSISFAQVEDDAQKRAVSWVSVLDSGVLPIQGPPGSGKSHTAAEMIVALVQKGKRVGVTALSHKVITGLIEKAIKTGNEKGVSLQCLQKVSTKSQNLIPQINEVTDNAKIISGLRNVNIIGGTPWLWAREDLKNTVDFLFVDEAGQLSLIDTVAVSQAATNLVLLGDPQQLKQPQQGSHPEGTEVSALEHILKQSQTIRPERGIFLDITWRLHPTICSYISELFYESKLDSKGGLENQVISSNTEIVGSGLRFVPVVHDGNQSSSIEEVQAVKRIVSELLNGSATYTNFTGQTRAVIPSDIKIITPYNAQVNILSEALNNEIQVGTVDKFQGQESPVIIYSMATSSPEDAPRGMEFLYSPNRLNVAASRARAMFILVASPKLFEPDCKSIAQIKLANAFCRYREVSQTL